MPEAAIDNVIQHPAVANRRFEIRPTNAAGDKTVEIYIYDIIGDWWGEGVSAKRFIQEVTSKAADATRLVLYINSPGGDAFDGDAIYNFLVRHKATVEVNIDGFAASAAATISMAGDEINIAENGLLMIHNSWSCCCGKAVDMQKTADLLAKLDATICDTYAARSGQDKGQVKAWMNEETWFSAEEAVINGFATAINPAKRAAALGGLDADRVASRMQLKHTNRLSALMADANEKETSMPSPSNNDNPTPADEPTPQPTEEPTPDPVEEPTPEPPPEPVDEPTPEPTPQPQEQPSDRAECKRFVDVFGAEAGGKYFADGLSFADAQSEHIKVLTAANEKLKKQVAAAGGDLGLDEPVAVQPDDGKSVAASQYTTLTPGLAQFAAGIKLPKAKAE